MEHHGEEYAPAYLTLHESLILVVFFLKCQDFQSRWQFWGSWGCSRKDIEISNCFYRCCQTQANGRQSPIILILQLITFIQLSLSCTRGPTKGHFSSVVFCTRPAQIQLTPLSSKKVLFIITLSFMLWAEACAAPHCIHLGQSGRNPVIKCWELDFVHARTSLQLSHLEYISPVLSKT